MRGDWRDFLGRVATGYGLVALLLLAMNFGAIVARRFPDPDDALRLVQLRDWLGGQGWYDLTQHRVDGAHGGVMMHWSRLVDLPLAGVVLVLRPVLGAGGAELAALVLVPMLCLAVVMLLVGRLAWERLGREACLMACLMLAMAVPVVAQIRPMRIDHHGWQIAAALLAVQGLMTRHARAGGWLTGAAMALDLAISLEGLPLVAVLGGLGAWRWWRGERGANATRLWLVFYAQGLAVAGALLFAATRLGDLGLRCDASAPQHLAAFGWIALVLSGLAAMKSARLPVVLMLGWGVAGVGALAIYFGLAPQCRAGSFHMLDPLVQRLWYAQVAEGLPIWRQDWTTILQGVIPPVCALVASLMLARRKQGEEAIWWQEYSALLGGAMLIGFAVSRAGAVTGALCAVPLAWAVGELLFVLRNGRTWDRRLAGLLGLVAMLVPAAPLTLYAMMAGAGADRAGPGAVRGASVAGMVAQSGMAQVSACDIAGRAGVLAQLPKGTVLAPLDIGPALLLASPHDVVATGHHRGAAAMREVIAAFTAKPDAARAMLRARHVRYLALCPDIAEPQIYARAAPDGLAAALLARRVPEWLEPVGGHTSNRDANGGDGLRLWQVKD